MTTTFYRAEGGSTPSIQPVEVESITTSTVTINGRRRNRQTTFHAYFPTWKEAKDYLYEQAADKLAAAENTLRWCRRQFEAVDALKQAT